MIKTIKDIEITQLDAGWIVATWDSDEKPNDWHHAAYETLAEVISAIEYFYEDFAND